jgi:membrane associated rhomboid family serine protease
VLLPAWYRRIPQPVRWAVGGAMLFAAIGGVYGVIESLRDYPASSWFGVTVYVSMLGAVAGFLIGVVAGAVLPFAASYLRRR